MIEVGEGWGEMREMASVASEADRSLAKVFIAVLAGCLLPGGYILAQGHRGEEKSPWRKEEK